MRVAWLLLEPGCALTGDEPSWIEIGRQVGRPAVAFSPLRSDLVFYPPVYPYFVGGLFRAFGTMRAVLWAQVVLGALLVPAVGRAGALAFGRRVGLLAAGATAFYPELVWYPAHYWSETVFLLLLWWAIERTLVADARGSRRVAVAAGVAVGARHPDPRDLAVPGADRGALDAEAPGRSGGQARARRTQDLTPALSAFSRRCSPSRRGRSATPLVFRAFIPVSTMGGLNLWQGNTTLTHLQIYEVLATKGGPVEQDRYCRAMARKTIAERQPAWILEKLRSEMPEFWKAGSEVLDHLVGREACGPLPAREARPDRAAARPAVPGGPRPLPRRPRARPVLGERRACCCSSSRPTTPPTSSPTPATRFRLPVLPVVFMVAAAVVVGRRDGTLLPLRGWRFVLLVALAVAALATLAPGLEELATWRLLAGRAG